MTVILFLADGFELVEALTPLDLLRRAGATVVTVSLNALPTVTSSNGVTLQADATLSALPSLTPDLVILPGGMPGAEHLSRSKEVCDTVTAAVARGIPVGAICAAPMVLGKLGLLRGKKATCFPGFEAYLDGATLMSDRVVCDGGIVTAAGMGVSLPFAAALVSLLYGKDTANKLLNATMAEPR